MAPASQQVQLTDTRAANNSAAYEEENVHAVYDVIADHFSSTRYKPWPLVATFLSTIPPGSIGADLGCGNGKYLYLRSALGEPSNNSSLITLGADRCEPLVRAAQYNFPPSENTVKHIHDVAVSDALCSNYRDAVFDYALSIATIHHFSTPERRRQSIEELIRIVKPVQKSSSLSQEPTDTPTCHAAGRFMVYVWAFEQRGGGRRLFDTHLADCQDAAAAQDVLVPWVRTAQHTEGKEDVHHRYYHLFRENELDELVQWATDNINQGRDASLDVVKEAGGWEKGNWWGVWQVTMTTPPQQA